MLQNVTKALDLIDSLDKQPKISKLDTRFGIWNVRSLYGAGSLITAVKEISDY
jgi:hypothetical protein